MPDSTVEYMEQILALVNALQDKIFMPMITGHADGTGLGLSIAQSLVQQHNGLIEFTSKPGKTIFTILLPINLHDGTEK